MPRNERELAYHWRVEVSKAYRILDRLWQGPTPTWSADYTIRDVRQAAHLCREIMILLGSHPETVEEYAQELFSLEHEGENWTTASWNLHSVYRERARSELQSMAPAPGKVENALVQAEPGLEAMQKAGSSVKEIVENYYRALGVDLAVDSVRQTGPFEYEIHLAPVRVQQHEQQEELYEHE